MGIWSQFACETSWCRGTEKKLASRVSTACFSFVCCFLYPTKNTSCILYIQMKTYLLFSLDSKWCYRRCNRSFGQQIHQCWNIPSTRMSGYIQTLHKLSGFWEPVKSQWYRRESVWWFSHNERKRSRWKPREHYSTAKFVLRMFGRSRRICNGAMRSQMLLRTVFSTLERSQSGNFPWHTSRHWRSFGACHGSWESRSGQMSSVQTACNYGHESDRDIDSFRRIHSFFHICYFFIFSKI